MVKPHPTAVGPTVATAGLRPARRRAGRTVWSRVGRSPSALLGMFVVLSVVALAALCSVAVDLRISEVVDAPNWLVSAYLPKAIFV